MGDFPIVLLDIVDLLTRESAAIGWLAAALGVEMHLVEHQFVSSLDSTTASNSVVYESTDASACNTLPPACSTANAISPWRLLRLSRMILIDESDMADYEILPYC